MWRRFSRQLTALLLAEILLIQPALLRAAGYDEGQQTGGQLLNQYQSPNALQQLLPTLPNYTDAQRDQYLTNPYYTQDPYNKGGLSNFERDSAQAIAAPQGMTGEVTTTLRARAVSPWSWTFGWNSTLVSGMQHNLPTGVPMEQGCRPVAYCATPGGTATTQTCRQTQIVDQAVCRETYTLETQPDGSQQEVFHDSCTAYKQPPWFPLHSVCLDPPNTSYCQPSQQTETRQYTGCIDHWLDVGLSQQDGTVVLQKWDDHPGSHRNCGADYLELDHIPVDAFSGPPSITVAATGRCSGSATVTLGDRIRLFSCGNDYHTSNTITWSIPLATESCHGCWDLERTFGNATIASSSCGTLEAQGCNPSDQRCLTDDCTTVERTYTCYDNAACNQWEDQLLCSACYPDPPGPPRCVDTAYPANGDFLTVAAMTEANATIGTDKDAAVRVFPGDISRCTTNPLVNCCSKGEDAADQIRDTIGMLRMGYTASQAALAGYFLFTEFEYFTLVANQSGILTSALNLKDIVGAFIESIIYDALVIAFGEQFATFIIGYVNPAMIAIQIAFFLIQMLVNCSVKSIETSAKKDLNLCHYVGKYCSVKFLFFCFEYKRTYCCFHSVLGKIIQEQGRAQIELDWGSAKDPDCEGLTVEQLARIDFSRIDLSEYVEDLRNRMDWPDASTTTAKRDAAAAAPIATTAQNTIAAAGSLGARVQNAIAIPPPRAGEITLSLVINGSGTVTVSPGGSCSASCTLTVPTDTALSLTAGPAADWTFTGWGGACAGTAPCALTLTAPGTVSATFVTTKTPLTVVVGAGGTVTSSPAGIVCTNATCTHLFDPGTTVTLTATAADATWQFLGWDGDCSGTNPCTLTLNDSRQVSALFYQMARIVTFAADTTFPAPAGVTITWTTTAINGTPPLEYQYAREDNGNPVLVQDWSAAQRYTWVTNDSSVGRHRLQVLVRSHGVTDPEAAEDWRITDPFTIMPGLQVYSVTPGSGARGATVSVTLSGQSFRVGDLITISGSGVTVDSVSVISDSQIQATLTIETAAATGSRNVTVTDPAGVSATLSNGFTVL